jgi:GGDEF domain-containing protein
VLAPFVQSLRAALDARTACYLVQEDVVPAYRICAIASADPEVRTAGTFETAGPLLTATMSNQPVTIRGLEGEKAVSDYLGYYTSSPAIDHVALAPVRRPDDPHTHFLLVDAAPGTDLGTRAARDLLKSYADTLRFLLDGRTGAGGDANGRPVEDLFAGGDTTSASEAAAAEAAEAAADRPAPPSDPSEPDEQQGPRPRREIIQEEMQAADAEGAPLALALVHLNRAEAIARDGEAAVASTEKLLRARLEENAPGFRVARFGELTYGVFVREGVDEVEAWAADLQDTFDRASGRLEGGVSIGVAVRTVHNDGPEELRADATEALRQAYQTGTCTIVE